jgi:2,3-diketo-5-methylthiopentyl-1-phosphate enolase
MVGGGLRADHIGALLEITGPDVILGIGGAIQGHPDGAAAGGRGVMEALAAAAADRVRPTSRLR